MLRLYFGVAGDRSSGLVSPAKRNTYRQYRGGGAAQLPERFSLSHFGFLICHSYGGTKMKNDN